MKNDRETNLKKGMNIKARRGVAYVVLAAISFLCLFWFYVLFINATRAHAELTKGFTPIPGSSLWTNWKNLSAGRAASALPIWYGLFNSFFISTLSAALCTYFSTMTVYAIHAYEFKMKKFMFTFILMIVS